MSHYIVTFKDSATKEEIQEWKEKVTQGGGKIERTFESLFNGFSAKIPPQTLQLLEYQADLGNSPIDYIEPDGIVTTQ